MPCVARQVATPGCADPHRLEWLRAHDTASQHDALRIQTGYPSDHSATDWRYRRARR